MFAVSTLPVRTRVIGTLLIGSLAIAIACRKPSPEPPAQPGPTQPGPTQPGPTQPGPTQPTAHEVVVNKELMITALSVVNDSRGKGPDGPWSRRADDADGGHDRSVEVRRELAEDVGGGAESQRVHDCLASANPGARHRPVEAKDNPGKTVSDDDWKVDFRNAPFRLLAIVNRLDLMRESTASVESAGEGRFVFGVVDPSGAPLPFAVIFEFEQLATTREQLRGWAQQWHALSTIGSAPFDETYKAALQVITDRFSGKNAAPGKPNGSALNQLRTNEIALVLPPGDVSRGWELRKFRIANGALTPVPTRQSPSNAFQNKPTLTQFVRNDNETQILDGTFEIPLAFKGASFLAASSIIAPPVKGFKWSVPPTVNNEARFKVALASCNGCHHQETATQNFVHVDNRPENQEAALSKFLTGDPDGSDFMAPDQGTGGFNRPFNDLKERARILKATSEEVGAVQLHSMRDARRFRVH